MSALWFVEAGGFFLQLLPCAALCFLPFGPEKLRIGRRRVAVLLGLAALALSVAFPEVTGLLRRDSYAAFNLLANLYMLAAMLLLVAAYGLIVREHYSKKLLVVYVVILYAAVIYWMVNRFGPLVSAFFGPWQVGINTAYMPADLVFYVISLCTIFPATVLFMRRSVAAFLREIEPEQMAREFRYATLSTVAFLALMAFADATEDLQDFYLLFLVLDQALLYWLIFNSSLSRSREESARRTVQAQRYQYDRITADMERAARMRHDMRHHWNYLYTLAEDGAQDEVRRYLAALAEQTGHRESEAFCQDPTLNALLQYYVGMARDEGIACTVAAECGPLRIPPEDLTVIVGNVLENAVNACRQAGGDMAIDVAVGVLHGAFTLEVVNTCAGVRLARDREDDGGLLPASAFRSIRGGGRGIASVSDLAEKHLGSAAFRYDRQKRTFTTQVILHDAS